MRLNNNDFVDPAFSLEPAAEPALTILSRHYEMLPCTQQDQSFWYRWPQMQPTTLFDNKYLNFTITFHNNDNTNLHMFLSISPLSLILEKHGQEVWVETTVDDMQYRLDFQPEMVCLHDMYQIHVTVMLLPLARQLMDINVDL